MNECHRSERVVDAVLSIGEGIFDGKNETGGELSERTPGVHESRRVGLEATLCHERIKIAREFHNARFAGAISPICFGNGGGDSPEHVLRRLGRFALGILYQIALLDDGSRILIEVGWTGCWRDRCWHQYISPGW